MKKNLDKKHFDLKIGQKLKKKYLIKIPLNVQVIYCDKRHIIAFVGPFQTKSLKLKVKVFLVQNLNLLAVTEIPTFGNSKTNRKTAKKHQGTTTSKLNRLLIETTYCLYSKLNFVGVGYRVFPYELLRSQVYFKLGYSHFVYFNIPFSLNSYCQKFTKLFLFGVNSFELLKQTTAQIRLCKVPEPYKGKGILYDQEKLLLKKGKKI